MAYMTVELLPRLGCANIVVTGLTGRVLPNMVESLEGVLFMEDWLLILPFSQMNLHPSL